MKKLMKLLTLMLVVLLAISVLVACDNDKDKDPDQGGTNTPPAGGSTDDGGSSGSAEFRVIFQFKDGNGNKLDEDESRKVDRGEAAKVPYGVENNIDLYEDWVVIGWDCDGDGKADELYKNVTKNLVAVSVVRPKAQIKVNFQDKDGNALTSNVTIKEGEPLTAAAMQACGFSAPLIKGYFLSGWELVSEGVESTAAKIVDECTFKALYAESDGVVPLVAKGAITMDGRRDDVYLTGAYLPLDYQHSVIDHNTFKTKQEQIAANGRTWNDYNEDYAFVRKEGGSETKYYVGSDTNGWGWMLWDGDYIYLLVEVADTTLCGRSTYFVNNVANAYLNDTMELWYSLEQEPTQSITPLKIAVAAVAGTKYKVDRTTSFNNAAGKVGNTFYASRYSEIEVKATNAVSNPDDDTLSATGYANAEKTVYKPSYRIEIKIPAWTEGVADVENHPTINVETAYDGPARDDFAEGETGDKAYQDALKDDSNYYFTPGTKLVAGNFIRMTLQINDLLVSQTMLNDQNSNCHDDQAKASVDISKSGNKWLLYNANGDEVWPWFSPKGRGQQYLEDHLTYSLGEDGSAINNVWGWATDDYTEKLTKAECDQAGVTYCPDAK